MWVTSEIPEAYQIPEVAWILGVRLLGTYYLLGVELLGVYELPGSWWLLGECIPGVNNLLGLIQVYKRTLFRVYGASH